MPQTAPTPRNSILVVDDQSIFCEMLEHHLMKEGYCVESCLTTKEALEKTNKNTFDLVIADVNMPGQSGIELLERLNNRGKGEKVILMTAFATINQGVDAMRLGASDYLTKPFQLNEVAKIVEKTLHPFSNKPNSNGSSNGNGHKNGNGNRHKNHSGDNNGNGVHPAIRPTERLVGTSPPMRKLSSLIEKIAPTNSYVLITGSTGTGKELVARSIHQHSHRRHAPFIDINCSAIPNTLFESELFGHQRGTFTGAHETRQGLFEQASGGTLFLDEINMLDLASQAKLLRVLQEQQLRRVGGRENIPIDVRIIAATNQNLAKAVSEGSFRPDLFFRLRVIPLHVPDLCKRGRKDISFLIEHFLQRHAERCSWPVRKFSKEAMEVLTQYKWPGNVRELENVVEYSLTISSKDVIGVDELPPDVLNSETADETLLESIDHCITLEELEREYIISMLKHYDGHQIKTAETLGIDRRTLYRKLQKYGLNQKS